MLIKPFHRAESTDTLEQGAASAEGSILQ